MDVSIPCLCLYSVRAAVILATLQPIAGRPDAIIRVRSPETMISTLLRDGVTRSPTLRQLVDTINSTNGIVYVEHGTCRRGGLHACLLMSLTMAGPNRVLHIWVDTHADVATIIASIAHELQHVVEALSEAGVTSNGLLEAFFERQTGGPTARGQLHFETEAAVRTGDAVHDEIKAYLNGRHVRSTDGRIVALVGAGEIHSSTFRHLLETLDESDVIIYLEPNLWRTSLYGYVVNHVTIAGRYRYLRARVSMQGSEERLISVIAHELEHATEIAVADDIRDDDGLVSFLERSPVYFGCEGGGGCYETQGARDVEGLVAHELKAAYDKRQGAK